MKSTNEDARAVAAARPVNASSDADAGNVATERQERAAGRLRPIVVELADGRQLVLAAVDAREAGRLARGGSGDQVALRGAS